MTLDRSRGVGRRLAVVAVVLPLAAGCAVVEQAAEDFPRMPGPEVTELVPSEPAPADVAGSDTLSSDGFDAVRQMAVRIRNVGCGSLSTGSGFAIDATTLITNKHVVAGSAELQVQTYDGRDVDVTASTTADLADLAVVRTDEELSSYPELAGADPVRGDAVTVVGYPQGGRLTVTQGQVIGETTDPLNENLGEVLVTDAAVEPGSSGSAVLDEGGRVVGVVYAKSAAGQSFIVPVSTLESLLADDAAFVPTETCAP
ncbi:S1C family serine protease [Actinotalea sp. C106]|uniref:S1C family serine protease n=1 Tax=Actinotalea sp. C106 TaxID=2908644 RepID=UPI0020283524|nr:serine protease [Actinotalea sp. C106]